MAFQQKDLKILWGKAAARCSMPECRRPVVADASDSVPSKAILHGENCHIVAESQNGPRGKGLVGVGPAQLIDTKSKRGGNQGVFGA